MGVHVRRNTQSEAVVEHMATNYDGKYFREDGELFLVSTLYTMLILPLAIGEKLGANVDRDQIRYELIQDALAIANESALVDERRIDIPASHVARASGRIINQLNLKNWLLWDES